MNDPSPDTPEPEFADVAIVVVAAGRGLRASDLGRSQFLDLGQRGRVLDRRQVTRVAPGH